jgi:hypothetical protein
VKLGRQARSRPLIRIAAGDTVVVDGADKLREGRLSS